MLTTLGSLYLCQTVAIADNCLIWVLCLCVCSSNAHAWLSALTLRQS